METGLFTRHGRGGSEYPYVSTDLPLPATSPASLTVYCRFEKRKDTSAAGIGGRDLSRGETHHPFRAGVHHAANEEGKYSFSPETFRQLTVGNPDLWWPYQWGTGQFLSIEIRVQDRERIRIPRHSIRHSRDHAAPRLRQAVSGAGRGGSFYLKVNGRDFLIRGAVYTPDLLFKYDEGREANIVRYVKDMGLNLLRWESKMSSEHMVDLADREGIPVMMGWMCCNQWEHWEQWDPEDYRVASESLRSQIHMLRSHPSAVLWANGSDGRPPDSVRHSYHKILDQLHWQNASVDTVSGFSKDATGKLEWDGIRMEGPYSWRSPAYWFSGEYKAATGSCAEQGDNESIPPYESLKKFIPGDKLWPISDWWYYHAGSTKGNSTLANITLAIEKRYGPSRSAAEFAEKAQLAHYENSRAQFESFAAGGWTNHKMTLYWMLNSPWPSFFGHIIDYYLKPGGAYYGAKQGLKPVSIVFDSYATGNRKTAKIYVVNQTLTPLTDLNALASVINLDGTVMNTSKKEHLDVPALSSMLAVSLPRVKVLHPHSSSVAR